MSTPTTSFKITKDTADSIDEIRSIMKVIIENGFHKRILKKCMDFTKGQKERKKKTLDAKVNKREILRVNVESNPYFCWKIS